jgi:DNA-binding transcriptional MerR regulator
MEYALYSTNQLCAVTGLHVHVLNDWCKRGVMAPAEGGTGQGQYRRFSRMQVLGLMVVLKLYNGERGCKISYVKVAYDAFTKLNEETLKVWFSKGRCYFSHVENGKVVLTSAEPDYEAIDVEELYQQLVSADTATVRS